jgi:dTDP-glucose 4,6-dehydratase
MHVLVLGGSGFIGGNFIRYLLKQNVSKVVNVDNLSYSGKSPHPQDRRYKFVHMNIADERLLDVLYEEEPFYIVNFAAQTHVDKSIVNTSPFVQTNVVDTHRLLETLRKYTRAYKLIHISTDEVYGQLKLDEPSFTENHPYAPNNPYAASKASSDHLMRSFYHTHNVPVVITHSSNNYGPLQNSEKFIPKSILSVLNDEPIKIYGNGQNIRDWMFVEDNCVGIYQVMLKGRVGERYNIGSNTELPNNEVAKQILSVMNKPLDMIQYIPDRLGHDFRYSIDCTKLNTTIGWKASTTFPIGLQKTIDWYINNQEWIKECLIP